MSAGRGRVSRFISLGPRAAPAQPALHAPGRPLTPPPPSAGTGLLTSPRLLFLDEPTTGLDAGNAEGVCALLAGLSRARNCTIVATLHQPSTDIVAMFDGLILLARGAIVFHGPFPAALDFFAARGHPLPELTDAADHFLDVLAEAPETFVAEALAGDPEKPGGDGAAPASSDAFDARSRPHRGYQFGVLLLRNAREATRDKRAVLVQLGVNLVIGLIVGFYVILPNDETSMYLRTRILFFAALSQGVYGAMALITSFPAERSLQLRERAVGMYQALPFYVARVLVDNLKYMGGPVVYALASYWQMGLQATAAKFFIYTAVLMTTVVASMALSLMATAVSRTTRVAVIVLPVLLELSRLFSGFYTYPNATAAGWKWVNYLSYLYYSYMALVQNELSGLKLDCSLGALRMNDPECAEAFDPSSYVRGAGFDELTVGECVGCLFAYTAICHAIGYFAVRKLKRG